MFQSLSACLPWVCVNNDALGRLYNSRHAVFLFTSEYGDLVEFCWLLHLVFSFCKAWNCSLLLSSRARHLLECKLGLG